MVSFTILFSLFFFFLYRSNALNNITTFGKSFSESFLNFVLTLNPTLKWDPSDITPTWEFWNGVTEMLFNVTEAGAPDIRSVKTSSALLKRCEWVVFFLFSLKGDAICICFCHRFWESVSKFSAQWRFAKDTLNGFITGSSFIGRNFYLEISVSIIYLYGQASKYDNFLISRDSFFFFWETDFQIRIYLVEMQVASSERLWEADHWWWRILVRVSTCTAPF